MTQHEGDPVTEALDVLAAAPGNVELEQGAAGLDRTSVVNVSETLVVDRARLVDPLGTLDLSVMRRVDDGLR